MGVTKVATGGDGTTANQTFGQNGAGGIQAHAFYPPLGAYFAGQQYGASANAICYAARPAADLAPTFTGIANASTTNALIRNSHITALDVVGNPTSDATRRDLNEVRIVFLSNNHATVTKKLPLGVHCMTVTGGTPTYRALTDGAGTNATVNTMTVVAGNAGTKSYAFAAVKDAGAGSEGNFGATADDGVVSIAINLTTNALTQADNSVTSPLVLTSSSAIGVVGTTAVNGAALCYDETLRRLYVGQQYRTGTHARAAGFGVQIFDVNASDGLLTPLLQAGTSLGNVHAVVATDNNIIATKGNTKDIAILNLKVMHTSTGPSSTVKFAYLIVNGGNGAKAAVSNRVWAIPLVVGSSTAPAVPGATNELTTINGTFANVNTANFSTRASAAGDLYQTYTRAALVGGGPLPCPAATAPSSMWVDGDAVYCSISAAAAGGATTAAITPGVWRSQAVFDRFGKIAHWTEWTKAAPNELGTSVSSGRVGFIAVDAKTTRMWGVDHNNTALRMTNWQNSSFDATAAAPVADSRGFLTNINTAANLGNGCTAALDLNASSTGWGATTPQRIALLGGLDGKVCFVKTGSGKFGNFINGSTPGDIRTSHTGHHHQFTSAQIDYTDSSTLLKTTIGNGKTVTCLGFSGWDHINTGGFFFAGTDEDGGLYVWAAASTNANPTAGFDIRRVRDFNQDPFRNASTQALGATTNYRSWQKLDRIAGKPAKIEARGGAVYILTRVGGATPMDRIYRITPKGTGALLNTDFVVTASTGQGALANVKRIVDFVISTSATTAYAGEQLTMLTNDGIYTTSSSQGTNGIFSPANAQLNCGWYQMTTPSTANTAQYFLAQPSHNRDPQSFWYSQWVANASDTTVYNKNELYLLERAETGFRPFANASINAFDSLGAAEPSDFAQNDIFTNFYSDGARRLFCKLSDGTYKLASRPFETSTEGWDMTSDYTTFGAAFTGVTYIHWISTLGDSGKLYAGTNKGVIGLV